MSTVDGGFEDLQSDQLLRDVSHTAERHVAQPQSIVGARLSGEHDRAGSRELETDRLAAMGTVMASAAHEFNNLLQVIQAYIAFPLDVLPRNSSVAADLATAMQAVRRAKELTEQLLRFGRGSNAPTAPTSIHQAIREFVHTWKPLLGPKIEWRVHLDADNDTVKLNVESFDHALANLCLNARDAMPDGGWLDIRTSLQDTGESSPSRIVVTIADTGVGMDPETLSRAFDPFYTTKPVGKGTGLGLPVTYGIISELGGEIHVHSELSVGTRFDISFPVTEEPAEGCSRANSTQVIASAIDGTGRLVLLAEDDPHVRDATDRMLRSQGFSTVLAANGDEAWEAIQQRRQLLSAAVIDEVMPGLSGREIISRLRDGDDPLPVVLCTGYSWLPSTVGPTQDVSRVVFLAKPFATGDLNQALAELLSAEAGGRGGSPVDYAI